MNSENKKKHYLIYQTTNLVNNKIYIGKHITENIEDQYFGSGKYLQNAIKKYGLEKFEFKILIDLNNEEEMNLLEKCVVTQEFCDREDTYNINVGGDGGWSYVNSTGYNITGNWKNIGKNSKHIFEMTGHYPNEGWLNKLQNNDPEKYKEFCQNVSNGVKKHIEENGHWWTGKKHSEKTKQKIKANRYDGHGENNSNYNNQWIYNIETFKSKCISKDLPIPDGWSKGRFCKATPEELKQRKQILEEILKLKPASKVTIRYKLDDLKQILNKLQNPKCKITTNFNQSHLQKQLNKIENAKKLEEKIKLLTEQYDFYRQFGWDKFVEKYQYKYSYPNFVQQCKKYVKDFVPQNGKKRGL